MLHKLSLDTNNMAYAIGKHRNRRMSTYFHLASECCQNASLVILLSDSVYLTIIACYLQLSLVHLASCLFAATDLGSCRLCTPSANKN